MSELLSLEKQKELLCDLYEQSAARATAEQQLCADYNEQMTRLEQDRVDEQKSLAETFEQQRDSLQQEYDAARSESLSRFERDTNACQAEYDRVLASIQNEHATAVEAARKRHEDGYWLLDSYFDDAASDSPTHQYEVHKFQITKTIDHLQSDWDDLEKGFEETVALMRRRRQWHDFAPPTHRATLDDQAEAQALFDESVAAARQAMQQLRSQKLPRLFSGWVPYLLFFVSAAGSGAAVAFLVNPAWLEIGVAPMSQEWFAISGGMAVFVSLIFLSVLLGIARRRSSRLYLALQQHVADARSGSRHWRKTAKQEFQRLKKESKEWNAAVRQQRDQVRQRIEATFEKEQADSADTKEWLLCEAHEKYPARLDEIAELRDRELADADNTYPRRLAQLEQQFHSDCEELKVRHADRVVNHQAAFERVWQPIATRWQAAVNNLRDGVQTMNQLCQPLFPLWPELAGTWQLPVTIPPAICIGRFEIDLTRIEHALPTNASLVPEQTRFSMPAVLPFPDSASLLLKSDGVGRDAAVKTLQTAMLRLMTSIPPGKIRFTIIDPVGLGENFSAFMHLADYDELMISNRIWTEGSHIEKRLADLTEHMENIFQTYLRNEFTTIQEYNAQAGEVAEPYHVLVIANFPANFTESAARRLVSIATSGAKCGVYTLISVDTKQPVPHRFELADLEQYATTLVWQNNRFVWQADELKPLPLTLESPPAPDEFVRIVKNVGKDSKDARHVEVSFDLVTPPNEAYWTSSSRTGIDVPLGRAGATKLQHMRLGSGTSQHVLVAGKTGSGKSSFLHALITNLALHYSSDEIEFYLVDFKKGVEFKTYAINHLPHARVIAIESDREFGLSVLQRLDGMLKDRGDLFRQHGVQDVAHYRQVEPDARLPRILLIIDEFHEFFVEDDKVAQTAALLLDRLVRQGRAFGIHVLLGSQTLGGAYSLARSTMGQVAVRVALQCSEADAHLILSEGNTAARLLTRPGEAIYNDANGLLEGNHPFQIVWLSEERRDHYLGQIRQLAEQRKLTMPPPIVFEGNIPADVSTNDELTRLAQTHEWDEAPRERKVWVGEPVEIKSPTAASFRHQSGSNLLVVGHNEPGSMGILTAAALSLASQTKPFNQSDDSPPPQFYVLDDRPLDASEAKVWQSLADTVPHRFDIASPRHIGQVLTNLSAELVKRNEQPDDTTQPIYLFLFDLGRFRDLRKEDDDFGFGGFNKDKPVSPSQQFADLLRDGPALGLHTLVWCDTYNNVNRWLSSQMLREFEVRILFQMSATDSSHLIDSTAAARLGTNRALLCLMEQGTLEKFRPYGLPTQEWLMQIRQSLQNTTGTNDSGDEFWEDINAWTVT